MEIDEGRLSFDARIGLSSLREDVNTMVQLFESGAVKIDDAFYLGKTMDANKKEIRDMVSTTKSAIREMEHAYQELMDEINSGTWERESNGHHIGINNMLDRLKLIYAGRAEVGFTRDDEDYGGTRVRIMIPLVTRNGDTINV